MVIALYNVELPLNCPQPVISLQWIFCMRKEWRVSFHKVPSPISWRWWWWICLMSLLVLKVVVHGLHQLCLDSHQLFRRHDRRIVHRRWIGPSSTTSTTAYHLSAQQEPLCYSQVSTILKQSENFLVTKQQVGNWTKPTHSGRHQVGKKKIVFLPACLPGRDAGQPYVRPPKKTPEQREQQKCMYELTTLFI